MKNPKRIMMIVLGLALVFALFAGCGGGTDPTEAPATEEPAAGTTQEPAGEPAEEPGDASGLPLVDELTELTLWATINPGALAIIDSYSDNTVIKKAEELTNVHLECTSVAGDMARDAFPLMINTGDYCDYIGSIFQMYGDGMDAAIDNEIIIDLSPYLEEYAPNYWEVFNSNPGFVRDLTTDTGNIAVFGMMGTDFMVDAGYMVRQDWLDDQGLALPETYDDWYDTLKVFKSEYDATLYINPYGLGNRQTLTDGYGVASTYDAMEGYSPFYVIDGEVRLGYIQPEFKDYLTMMAQWYSEGLIWPDFPTGGIVMTMKDSEAYQPFLNGKIGFGMLEMGNITSAPQQATEEGMVLAAVTNPVLNKGDTTHIATAKGRAEPKWAVSTSCEDVALACRYIDFWFTDTGYELGNYGLEGEAFNWVDGERVWTELLVNNPDGVDFKALSTIYMLDDHPFLLDSHRTDSIYSPEELAASDTWLSNRDGAWGYPTAASMTAEEAELFSVKWNEINTYTSETIPQFIMGTLDIEAEFDNFVARIQELGLEDCATAKQEAYNRYVSR